MSTTMFDEPAATLPPISQRIRTAYFKARQREGSPAGMLDMRFNTMQRQLTILNNPAIGRMSDDEVAARDKILADAEEVFTKWAEMPEREMTTAVYMMQHPPQPPPAPGQQAQDVLASLEQRGIRIELWHKTFRVMPSAKLEPQDKAVLSSLKAPILAELHRRADAWSPE